MASKKFIFITSADLQFDIRELALLLPLSKEADIVAGYRLTRPSYNWWRHMLTAVNLFLLRLFFGLRSRDPSWVKLIRRDVFKTIRLTSPRFFWTSELLIQAQRQNLRLAEVGVNSYGRKFGKSTGGNLKTAASTFFELIRFWLKSP